MLIASCRRYNLPKVMSSACATPGPIGPILCAPLLRKVDQRLIELLRTLTPPEWDRPTVSPRWVVRDVAAHLLDTTLRKLSMVRDSCFVESVTIRSPQDVAALVNRMNAEGVAVFRRFSPAVLVDLMEVACRQSADFHESLDPFAPAVFAVSWAGEAESLNWFDTARELTERWHHQQQIRLTTDRPGIMTPELYHPVLDCFLRGLPHLYRELAAPAGTTLRVEISGECGGQWYLTRSEIGWALVSQPANPVAASITIPQEIAWRVFTKGIARRSLTEQTVVSGDAALAAHVLDLVAIVA